jgi:tetratricopeptide (TPR) repeat protein
MAEESGDPALYMVVSTASYVFFLIGEHREGVAVLERAIELADGDPAIGAGVVNDCPLANCLVQKGGYLCDLGRLEEGGELIERGLKLASEQDASETVGWGHMWSTFHAYWSGDAEQAMAHSQQALAIADRIGDSFSRTWSWYWLGLAACMRGEWRQAVEAIEQSQALAAERRTAADSEAWCLIILGEAYLGLGDAERAAELLRGAVALMRSRGQAAEVVANVVLARILLGSAGLTAREEIESALERASELSRETDMCSVEPMIHAELAELARQNGDEDERQRELREAHRLFSEFGATGHAERLSAELAPAS